MPGSGLRIITFMLVVALSRITAVNILYSDFLPCHQLRSQCMEHYKNATVYCVPWKDWYSTALNDLRSSTPTYDLFVLDSQWIGEAASEELILELTDWVKNPVNIILDDYYENAFRSYSEYPQGSGHYYSVPLLADAMVMAYRTDILEKLDLKDIFTLEDLLNISQKIVNEGLSPAGFTTAWCSDPQNCYDEIATVWNQFAWSFGGELWDPTTYRIKGILDSTLNEEALNFTKQLFATTVHRNISELISNYNFTHVVDDMCNGRAAIGILWASQARSLTTNPPRGESCPLAANISFTPIPAGVQHSVSLGGQGISVAKRLSKDRIRDALNFIGWFSAHDQQIDFVARGGLSCRQSVTASGFFLRNHTYGPIFLASFPITKDFWNLPEFFEMLQIHLRYLGAALEGKLTSEQALRKMANEQQKVIDRAYPNGPPGSPTYTDVDLEDSAVIAALTITAIAAAVVATTAVLTFIFRKRTVIRFASVTFLLIVLLGAELLLAAVGTAAYPGDATCTVTPWLAGVGFVTMFSSLFAKQYRVWRLFGRRISQVRADFEKMKMTTLYLLRIVGFMLAVEVVILSVWTAVDPPVLKEYENEKAGTKIETISRCESDNPAPYLVIFFSYKLVILAAGSWISFRTRTTESAFNETKTIGISIYNFFFCAVLMVALLLALQTHEGTQTPIFIILFLGIVCSTIAMVCVIFGAKFWVILWGLPGSKATDPPISSLQKQPVVVAQT